MDAFMRVRQPRYVTLALACISAGLLTAGLFLQYVVALIPCPLCILQRFFYLANILIGLIFFFQWPWARGGRVSGGLIALSSLAGGAIAARQVWLQHQPVTGDPTLCGVSFGSFLHSVILALGGRGNCSIVDWTLFSFSIAEWSLFWFVVIFSTALWLMSSPEKQPTDPTDTPPVSGKTDTTLDRRRV